MAYVSILKTNTSPICIIPIDKFNNLFQEVLEELAQEVLLPNAPSYYALKKYMTCM